MHFLTPMRWLTLLSMLSACAVQQQNGQDIRINGSPLITGQPWNITQQTISRDKDHICTVSAGELDVTLRGHHRDVRQQVAISYTLNPGQTYKIRINGHIYETQDGRFDNAQSQAIIQYIQTSDMIYTERQNQFIDITEPRLSNSIATAGFAEQYHLCTKFVQE